ncbi:hypothetical protein CHUAL_001639 [Chamberlinius hualienensis]
MPKSNPTVMDIQRMRLTLAQLGKNNESNEDDNLASEQDFQMDSSDMEHHGKIHHSPSSFSHKGPATSGSQSGCIDFPNHNANGNANN